MRFLIRITGTDSRFNAAGSTYQYIAFCDPGMRFALADCLSAWTPADVEHAIGYPGWTPEYAFLQGEDATTSSTVRGYQKGIGQTANEVNPYNATEMAAGLTFAENKLTVRTTLSASLVNGSSSPFILFRRADGNNDPGQARVLQLATYVGDGAASRTISLSPASGRRPLFAIVTPHNTIPFYRDPSHLTVNSGTLDGGVLGTTSITSGGIDQITVGTGLNSNGVVYDVFVLPGSTTAGNGGWSINENEWPVEPNSPLGGGPWGEEPEEPGEIPGPTPPGPEPGDETYDFSDDCVDDSVKIINRALSYIGISKQVGDILTEASIEAVTARLHYSEDVSATLRDYPWGFATRYATLALVAGSEDTPVNGDWTYSYRVPARMIFARRIVNPDGSKRDYDPDPPRFRVGSDDTGGLIYTDVEEPELEYTVRLPCVATSGDALFRKALTWRHAASLAPTLSRDEKKVDFCMGVYLGTLEEARAKDAAEQQQSPEGDVDWIRGRD